MALHETAYAKINLALHVRGRRPDGYHDIETLFAFVDDGDRLEAQAAARDELRTVGEFGGQIPDPFSNIVARALTALPRVKGLAITLDKRLPVAAGLGGGSADAGAVFRLVERERGLPDDWEKRAARLGADVPACVRSEPCVGRGTGATLDPVANTLAGTSVLLVNPRMPLATGPVFERWDGTDSGPLPEGDMRTIALAGRNDLEACAIGLCPQVTEVLAALRDTGAWLVRMSGSGATCFALFERHDAMLEAAERLASGRPDWWQMSGRLR